MYFCERQAAIKMKYKKYLTRKALFGMIVIHISDRAYSLSVIRSYQFLIL